MGRGSIQNRDRARERERSGSRGGGKWGSWGLGFGQWTEGVKWGGRLGLVGWPSGVDGLLGRGRGGGVFSLSFFFLF